MNKLIKIVLLLPIMLFLNGCLSHVKMDSQSLSKLKAEKKNYVIFKATLDYNNSFVDLHPISKCNIYFSTPSGKGLQRQMSTYVDGGNYIVVSTDNAQEDIYLDSLQCMEYRVFYNKVRVKNIKKKIASISKKNHKSGYGGDIEIVWVPETFKASDLFNLGNMGMQDAGILTARVKDNYTGYVRFMKDKYNKKEIDLINVTDKEIIGKILSERKVSKSKKVK